MKALKNNLADLFRADCFHRQLCVFHSILRDIKKDIDSGEQPVETVTAAMLQNIQNAAKEQQQELCTVNDVTALVTEQIEKVMPQDEETSEQFQQLMKKMIEQAGKQGYSQVDDNL